MPLYEDETLHGALKKAIRGGRSSRKKISKTKQTTQDTQKRNECRDIRNRFFSEAGAIIVIEGEIRAKMQDLQAIIDEVGAAKDTGLEVAAAVALKGLGRIVTRLRGVGQAAQTSGRSRRPTRDDFDDAVEAGDIANDLGGVISGLVEIARGQPRIRRLNNELSELRDRVRRHTDAKRALRSQFFAGQCLEFFPL